MIVQVKKLIKGSKSSAPEVLCSRNIRAFFLANYSILRVEQPR